MSAQDYTEIIKDVLAVSPPSRDDDVYLFTVVLNRIGWSSDSLTLTSYFSLLKAGKLPSFDTVSRLRRMLQEEFPELRGAKYAERHQREKDVKEQLGYKEKSSYVEEELFERSPK